MKKVSLHQNDIKKGKRDKEMTGYKKYLYGVLFLLVVFLVGCTHTVLLQPHIGFTPVSRVFGDKKAGLYISSAQLGQTYTTYTFFGGKMNIPLGTPLKDLAYETFLPFYREVTILPLRSFENVDHIIEVSIDKFNITEGLDAKATASCIVTDKNGVIFSGSWLGEGKGTATAGLLSDSLAREQIRKASEEALTQAFQQMRGAFKEKIENLQKQ